MFPDGYAGTRGPGGAISHVTASSNGGKRARAKSAGSHALQDVRSLTANPAFLTQNRHTHTS